MSELMILKLGGSVITDKHSEEPKVNFDNLNRLADELKEAYSSSMKLILIHGAGSYGHQIVSKTGINKGITTPEQVVAFAETQRLQNELNVIVTNALIERGIPAIPCQASASAVMAGKKLKKMDTDAIKGFLEVGMIPVLYGVPAYDTVQKCSILSGDEIAPYLARELGAKKIIHGTNVNGIYTADPNKDENAKHIPEITPENLEEVKEYLAESSAVDVTGGMMNKVNQLLGMAEEGIESQIMSILEPGNLVKALNGEKVGTIVKA